MTEEINHAFDGGLYAELIQNRAFKNNATPTSWSLTDPLAATMQLDSTQPVPNTALDKSLRLTIKKAGEGVVNDGFWGIPATPNTTYQISFWAKADADFKGALQVGIESNVDKKVFAKTMVPAISGQWKKYSGTLKTGNLTPSLTNGLAIRGTGTGTIWLTQVSLFPPTYKNRPNGLRVDLMEKMAAMKPTFLRFPGGNYLDPGHYQWKDTIGPVDQRPDGPGAWGYRSSYGLGILEFMEWCEDLNMEPVLGVTDGRPWLPANGDVAPLVQDALDEIDYVSGGVNTKWGALRAAHGHPKPLPLRFVEIGNEDFFDKKEVYEARFAKFYDAIKAKHPDIQIIATRADVTIRKPDIIDDHYYRTGRAMAADHDHYAASDRNGSKIFVGEWASTEGNPTPNLQAALGDAAWLTGLERSSDHVIMEAYAPLLVNVNPQAAQWPTNLIGYNALDSYGSPAYYVQTMFGQNTGDVVLPTQVTTAQQNASGLRGRIGVGTWSTQAEFDDLKVTAPDGKVLYSQNFANGAPDFQTKAGEWKAQNGVYAQSGGEQPAISFVGDMNWTDYDYTLRARKIGGGEGFVIPFRVRNGDNYLWWNVGGWGNERSRLQRVGTSTTGGEFGSNSPFKIETNRWYDLKIEVRGTKIRTFADGKLINEASDEPETSFYTVASRDTKTGDILLKAVNFTAQAQTLQIKLDGAQGVGKTAVAQVLTGLPTDINSIDNPRKVAPQTVTLNSVGPNFTHEFPAFSVTVVRFKAAR